MRPTGPDATYPVMVTLEDRETHEVRVVKATGWNDYEGVFNTYSWADGNYACDCNRASFFEGRYVENAPCGDTRFRIVSITDLAGTVLYAEPPEPEERESLHATS
jgi:hypothetical protein